VQEVANARIYDGVHYRTSTEVGTAMGKQIGALAAAKYLDEPHVSAGSTRVPPATPYPMG
jgi:hypothetical protein